MQRARLSIADLHLIQQFSGNPGSMLPQPQLYNSNFRGGAHGMNGQVGAVARANTAFANGAGRTLSVGSDNSNSLRGPARTSSVPPATAAGLVGQFSAGYKTNMYGGSRSYYGPTSSITGYYGASSPPSAVVPGVNASSMKTKKNQGQIKGKVNVGSALMDFQ